MGEHDGDDVSLDVAINDLLLPIVKGAGSERSYDQLAQALQVFGGSGYLQDYPLEQYIRDAKIDTLYEGTTAIQAQDFFFRKIVRTRARRSVRCRPRSPQFLDVDRGRGPAQGRARRVAEGARGLRRHRRRRCSRQLMSGQEDVRNVYKVGQNATRLLLSAGDLMVGYLLLRQAVGRTDQARRQRRLGRPTARSTRASRPSRGSSRTTVLPELRRDVSVAEGIDNALMDVPEAAF